MANLIKDWKPVSSIDAEVAPNYYDAKADLDTTIVSVCGDGKGRAFVDSVPYKAGDVVWVEDGNKAVLALISGVWFELDRNEFRRAKFRIQKATKAGTFSKQFSYTYPGFIQRGYEKAGNDPR